MQYGFVGSYITFFVKMTPGLSHWQLSTNACGVSNDRSSNVQKMNNYSTQLSKVTTYASFACSNDIKDNLLTLILDQ